MKLPLSTRIARRTLRGLPAPRFAVSYEPGLRIPMADGAELLADHYFPDTATGFRSSGSDPADSSAERSFPTLLVRSPYGRSFRWAALYGMAYAEQGFHVLLQSTRGTAGSGGFFHPWRDDGPDGRSTIAWLRRQPWFNGRLGLVGPSAVSYSHWALAADPPPELKAMVMQMPVHNPHGLFHRGGVFALEDALIATTTVKTRLPGPRRLRPNPADGHDSRHGPDLLDAATDLTVPTLVITGWADMALDQALQQYGRLPAARRSLLIGPWSHAAALRKGAGAIFAESLAWLRGHLIGPAPPKDQVRVAVGRTSEWRDLTAWPPAAVPTSWYPHPGGDLSREPPGKDVAIGVVRYDPGDPTPSLGGNSLARNAGVQDNKTLEERDDVLVFTSPPLNETTEVIGAVAAEILIGPGAEPATATLFVRLCDVDERGRSWNVCDGITRVTGPPSLAPPALGPPALEPPHLTISVAMSATAHRFRPGHRIRIQLSGGAHPRFTAGREAFRLDVRPGSTIVLPVC